MNAPVLSALPQRVVRNAGIEEIVAILENQQRHKVDLVYPVKDLRFTDGQINLACIDGQLVDDGVVDVNGFYLPTSTADGQIAGLFRIPVQYFRRMREENTGLLDMNVNEWAPLGAFKNNRYDAEAKVLLRMLWGSQEGADHVGIVRGVLSDRYGARDNLDTVMAMLEGMELAGLSANNISQCNLTDDRFSVFVEAPEVAVAAPELLKGYRPTIERQHGGTGYIEDVIHAGFMFSNSETGGGALKIVPRLVVKICTNGLQVTKDAWSRVHLGARLDEGNIVWSGATHEAANELVKNQVRDAVQAFLTKDYVQKAVDELATDAVEPLTQVEATIEQVTQKLGYTQDQRNGILRRFIEGGQVTSGGVMQAVTLHAQDIENPDVAIDFEATGIEAMRVAAAHARELARA